MEQIEVTRTRELVTVDQLKQMFPYKKHTITQETVDIINETNNDPEFDGYTLVQAMVDHEAVMKNMKAGMGEYVSAVKFCAFLEADNSTVVSAYRKAFWNRDFIKNRLNVATDSPEYKELTSAATRYKKSPLVVALLTRIDVPFHIFMGKARFDAAQVLINEMTEAKLSKDRIAAADKLLLHTKPPENIKLELGVTSNSDELQTKLYEQMAAMVIQQKRMLEAGMDITQVQKTGINFDYIEVDINE